MSKPNIIIVVADQLRYDSLGASGNSDVKTPNIDTLAEQGIVFNRAFSSCPICSPYRGQLLTGCYSHVNGVVDNEYKLRTDLTTLPQVLGKAGYHTAFVGKLHLGYGPYPKEKRLGFDYMAAYNHPRWDFVYYENEKGPIKVDNWPPENETNLTIRFIEDHIQDRGDQPFALILVWPLPHWPYDLYPYQFKTYDPNFLRISPNVPTVMADYARRDFAEYYGCISALDAQFGRILGCLDEQRIAENTLLCMTSDHGDHIFSHGFVKPMDTWMHRSLRMSKASPYDESAHIPFIARWPAGIKGSRSTDALFNSVDVMPSILGLCGIDVPTGVQGADLSHVFRGEEGPLAKSVYLQILGPGWPDRTRSIGLWRAVRTGRYTYARWLDNEVGPLLFDHDADPWDMKNLAVNPEYASILSELEGELEKWMQKTADPFDTGERYADTRMLKLGQEYNDPKWNRIAKSPHWL